jgi:hypothetical protein
MGFQGHDYVQVHPVSSRAYNLRWHLRVRTDERPSVCTAYGKRYARRSDCERHEALVCDEFLEGHTKWVCACWFFDANVLDCHLRIDAGRAAISSLCWIKKQDRSTGSKEKFLQLRGRLLLCKTPCASHSFSSIQILPHWTRILHSSHRQMCRNHPKPQI